MPSYDRLARFYDAIMDDPTPRADRVRVLVERYHPDARSVLELACGTGSILERLATFPERTGLDISPEMLAEARAKLPDVVLVEGDMRDFRLDRRFDVVVCVFDSINHLLDFADWESTFAAVADHLEPGGLFVFDVNTVGELFRIGEEQPWVFDFDGNVLIMDVRYGAGGRTSWDLRVFERTGPRTFALHHETIGELGVALSRVADALAPRFSVLEVSDPQGAPATDDSPRAFFACRRDG
ncbi:MAG: class I SAM-dependent methyltransferase [Acidimicrobiales bacterium]|nr:class I SAM-dependent methyltransferase [Acidimicrobiales bacterium]